MSLLEGKRITSNFHGKKRLGSSSTSKSLSLGSIEEKKSREDKHDKIEKEKKTGKGRTQSETQQALKDHSIHIRRTRSETQQTSKDRSTRKIMHEIEKAAWDVIQKRGKYSEKGKAKTIDVAQPSIPLPPPINNTNYDDTLMDLSFPSTVISNENTQTQVNKCKQPGMVDSLGMFLPSKNMLVPSSPPDFISSKPMMVFGKTFPKYDRFPLDAMHCQLDANNLHMALCAYAFPRAGSKSQADMKEGIPVTGTAPRLIFYNDRNAFNLNMDSKYIKRLIQFGLLFLSGNPHLPQDEQDMADIFTENPELEYPWNDMWELFENFKKLKVQSPTLNDGYSSADADLSLHENESEDGEDVSDEKGNESQDNELLSGSIEYSEFDFSDDEN